MASKIYALYQGETNLADGTLAQIANKRNVKVRTLYFLLSPAYKKRKAKSKKPYLELVEIIDDEAGRM